MPNHVKNRIELIGSPEHIESFVEKFSTFYPSEPNKAYDGRLIYTTEKKEGNYGYKVGWLDEQTGVFSQRTKDGFSDSVGIPDGFSLDINKEWTRFPDFEKIFPTPASIKSVGDSVNGSIISAVKAKYHANVSQNELLARLELQNRDIAKVKPEEAEQFLLACKAYEETGFAYWYDWNIENWGTKWNAYSCEKLADNIYTFETAWSGVPDMIKELSRYFKGVIRYKFADEDTGFNVGEYKFGAWVQLFENRPIGGSKEAYDIAFELRPNSKENYKLVDDVYEYLDED